MLTHETSYFLLQSFLRWVGDLLHGFGAQHQVAVDVTFNDGAVVGGCLVLVALHDDAVTAYFCLEAGKVARTLHLSLELIGQDLPVGCGKGVLCFLQRVQRFQNGVEFGSQVVFLQGVGTQPI